MDAHKMRTLVVITLFLTLLCIQGGQGLGACCHEGICHMAEETMCNQVDGTEFLGESTTCVTFVDPPQGETIRALREDELTQFEAVNLIRSDAICV